MAALRAASLGPVFLLASLLSARAGALSLPVGDEYHAQFDDTGVWRLETAHGPLLVNCGLRVWAAGGYFRQSDARPAAAPERGPAGLSFTGTLRIGTHTVRYWQTATPVSDGMLLQYAIAARGIAETDAQEGGNHFAAAFDLPAQTYRGSACRLLAGKGAPEPVTLPEEQAAAPRLIEREGARGLTIRRNGLRLSFLRRPAGKITLQDARKWHRPFYQALLSARRGPADPEGWRSVTVLLSLGKPPQGPSVAAVVQGDTPLPCRQIHEAELQFWAAYDNPFLPQQVRVGAEVTTPSGRQFKVPGFVTREHRRPEADDQSVAPWGHTRWQVRIAPREVGDYRYALTVETPAGKTTSRAFSFKAQPPRGQAFLRAPRRQTRYLEDENGDPRFLIGHNLCWPPRGKGPFALEEALRRMARSGINATRLWLCSWGLRVEGRRPDRYRLDGAWQLDRLLRLARREGVYVQLCLDNLTDLTDETRAGENPYLAQNGGPCRRPSEFFTSPTARQQHTRRLRYLVARCAPFTSLLAWELGSELDYATAERRDPALLDWLGDRASWLEGNDPYGHAVTYGLGLGSPWHKLWSLPGLEVIQPHVYIHRPVYVPEQSELDAAALILRQAEQHATVAKPLLVGEFGFLGSRDVNPLNEADTTGVHLHNALWAAALSGAAGTPLHWWWDSYVLRNKLHYHYAALARFLDGEPLPDEGGAFLRDTGKGQVRVLGFRTKARALLWIQHRENRWYRRLVEEKAPAILRKATIELSALRDGHYRVEWWDTYAGEPITHALVVSRRGVLPLRIPGGRPDLGCKVRRVGE